MARKEEDRDDVVAEISGRSIQVMWGGYGFQQSQWGSGRLMITPTRLIEKTKFFITSRETVIPLDQISGVTLLTTGNPLMLILTPLCGLGLLLYMLFKIRILVIHAANAIAVIGVKGSADDAQAFMEDLLNEVDRVKKARSGSGGGASAPAAPPSRPAPGMDSGNERVTSAPAKAGAKPINCPECDAEFRIPVTSAGKKFRCQKCQATIEVPADF